MERDESAQTDVRREVIAALEIHAPAARLVGIAVAQRPVVLPVDIEIAVVKYLRMPRGRQRKRHDDSGDEPEQFAFYVFHDNIAFYRLLMNWLIGLKR